MNVGVIPASDLTKEMSKGTLHPTPNERGNQQAGAQTEEDYGNKLSGTWRKIPGKHEQLMDVKSLKQTSPWALGSPPILSTYRTYPKREKKLKISYVNWLCAVEPVNGKYEVVLIFNRDIS